MKKLRVSMLALTVLGVAATVAIAAATKPQDTGSMYLFKPVFTNLPSVNLVDVYGLPNATQYPWVPGDYGVIKTDGAGKIEGVQDITIRGLVGSYVTANVVADISGKISTATKNKVSTPSVSLTQIKGNGFAWDVNKQGTASASTSLSYKSEGDLVRTPDYLEINFAGITNGYVNVIELNADGGTNYVWQDSVQSTQLRGAYTEVTVTRHYAQTNAPVLVGTNLVQVIDDVITTSGPYWFGTFLGTNNITRTPIPLGDNQVATNQFSYGRIGQNIIPAPFWNYGTNDIWGYSSADLTNFLKAFNHTNGQIYTNLVQVLVSTETTNVPLFSVTGGTKSYTNSWKILNGTLKGSIKLGKQTVKVDDSKATLTPEHELWSTQGITNPNTNGEVAIYRKDISGGLDILPWDEMNVRIDKFGKKFWGSADGGWSASGNVGTKKTKGGISVSTSKANFKGVADLKGSKLTIEAVNGILTQYIIDPTDPRSVPVVKTVANEATAPLLTQNFTNNTKEVLVYEPGNTLFPSSWSYTNTVGTNVTLFTKDFGVVKVPPPVITNTVAEAMKEVQIKSGTVLGQKIPKDTPGFNLNDQWPPY